MSAPLTIGSLFSGIGGLELGLERAGLGPTLWQVERDAYCRAVLATHWPDARRYEDVRDVGAHNLPPVDVLCGGFPCQDISSAGKKVGIGGARSGLWSEYARIIRELRPRYAVVENVADLLARGLGVVLGDLAALGYDAEWHCIPAAYVGAPHRRDRVWILTYPECEQRGAEPQRPDGVGQRGRPTRTEPRRRGAHVARADASGCERSRADEGEPHAGADRRDHAGRRRPAVGDAERAPAYPHAAPGGPRGVARESGCWAVEPDVGRVAHGVPARVDRLRALGNAVVPQVAEVVGRLIVAREAALSEAVA